MKKIIFSILLLCLTGTIFAQKYAFVDTEYIMSKIPAYKKAKDQLNELSSKWQKEVDALYVEIDNIRSKLKNEAVFLTSEMKQKKLKEIQTKEMKARNLQTKYFGFRGELYLKRVELIKPIQDEMYEAIKQIAKASNYSMVLDKASKSGLILFTNDRYDKSDKVLKRMGYKIKKKKSNLKIKTK